MRLNFPGYGDIKSSILGEIQREIATKILMRDARLYSFLHKQIPVLIVLSLAPGLGYLYLGWLNNIFLPAFIWYLFAIATSLWGWFSLYRGINFDSMSEKKRDDWYYRSSVFFYAFFLLWAIIFLLYIGETESKLHYIVIFTEIGASVVASSLLSSDRRLYLPTIYILMIPLITYFFLIGEWFGYILGAFACTFTWVLLYAAKSSNVLLIQTKHQATHDALTGLYNRQYFIEYLQKRMNSLNESGELSYILLIDLDHFKNINDSLGHDMGDKLLQFVVLRLQQNLPAGCIVARLGGDEFIIVGNNYFDRDACESSALAVSELLVEKLKATYFVDQHHLYISASIGASIVRGRGISANDFIKEADIALYEVKAKGRDGVFMFNEDMSKRVEAHLEIERQLHFALKNNEITLHYQPQLDRSGRIIGAECLARWSNPKLGFISPAQFIPIAEQTGLIVELGTHILETGFKTLREWRDAGIHLDQFSINISMRQFTHHNFVLQIESLLARHLDEDLRGKLMLELTESIAAEDINRVIRTMNKLKQLGIRFSMDDFGTGYSSLSYLNQLPLDEIKIDRSFVGALGKNERDQAMVVTILNMAHILKFNIVAEGVETKEQHDFLLNNNCQVFQGYLHSKPLSKEEFEVFYRQQT
jgi:diguanylate cyclase (GGDEF)-like protein